MLPPFLELKMIPTLNISVDAKNAIIGTVLLCAAGMFFLMGYATGKQPIEVVCKNYIEQAKTTTAQVLELEKEVASAKDLYTVGCVKREKDICSGLIKQTTDNIKKLRCRICKSQGVR